MEYVIIFFVLLCVAAYYIDYKKYKQESLRIKSYIDKYLEGKNISSDEKLVVSFFKSLIEKKSIINITRFRRESGIHFVEAGSNIFISGYFGYLDDDSMFMDNKWLSKDHLFEKNKHFVKNLVNFMYQECKAFNETKAEEYKQIQDKKLTNEFLKDTIKTDENKKQIILKEL